MKSVLLSLLVAVAQAQSSAMPASKSGMAMTRSMLAPTTTMPPAVGNVSAAEYSITALPAVMSQPSCVFNCLIPIGLADPSNCDDVTNQCACLNAPDDVLDVLVSCVQTVCKSSTDAYATTVTSLYESYCNSAFGTSAFSEAFVAESAAAASTSAEEASTSAVSATGSSTPNATSTSKASSFNPSIVITNLLAIGILSAILAF